VFVSGLVFMAKELPYFQFEPAEYISGNIQFCSLEEQGCFINVCSIYWQRSCEISKDLLVRKFGEALIDRLLKEDIIKDNGTGGIEIEFLKEQWQTITASKLRLSEAGKKGVLTKKQATLKPPLSPVEPPLKQLDEIRKDKKIEDNINEMAYADFEKIIADLENDFEWLEWLAVKYSLPTAERAYLYVARAFEMHVTIHHKNESKPIYFNDVNHVKASASKWYADTKEESAKRAKMKFVS